MDEDFLLALQLQEEWEAEDKEVRVQTISSDPPRPLSLMDDAWELLDPNPDVRSLFLQFNETLFWGRLAAVEVKWSPRMTLYAEGSAGEGGRKERGIPKWTPSRGGGTTAPRIPCCLQS